MSTATEFSEQVKRTAAALKMGLLINGVPPENVEDPRILEWLDGVAMNLESRNHQIDSLQRLFFQEDSAK